MLNGIKVFNGGKLLDLTSLNQNANGDFIISNIKQLQINLKNGAEYKTQALNILENNSDIRVTLADGDGIEISFILKNLNDILLTNQGDTPVFQVFDPQGSVALETPDFLIFTKNSIFLKVISLIKGL